MPQNNMHNNPYAIAAGAYGNTVQKHTPDQRELEANVLMKATRMLTDLQNDWESANTEVIEETLKYNRHIWMIFYDSALSNQDNNKPDDLRSNIINISNFIFKQTLEIMSNPSPDKLNVLIDINREIATGLMSNKTTLPENNEASSENIET